MKHIAIVIKLLNRKSGGAERLYCELANKLSAMGYQVSCLIYENGDVEPFYHLDNRVNFINLYVRFKNRSLLSKLSKLKSCVSRGWLYDLFDYQTSMNKRPALQQTGMGIMHEYMQRETRIVSNPI